MGKSDDLNYTDLLLKVSNGDQKSFSLIYETFYSPLLKHITSKIGDTAIAEDILHNLFLSLWHNRTRLVEISSLSAYLYTSCRYLIIQHVKKTMKDDHDITVFNESQLGNVQSIEDRLYYRYLLDIVNSEIENLPEKCKQVFKLSREDLKSNKEIAACLNISESTVENQINKALKRIRSATNHLMLSYIFFLAPAKSCGYHFTQLNHLDENFNLISNLPERVTLPTEANNLFE